MYIVVGCDRVQHAGSKLDGTFGHWVSRAQQGFDTGVRGCTGSF
jgi:hypothetical protein